MMKINTGIISWVKKKETYIREKLELAGPGDWLDVGDEEERRWRFPSLVSQWIVG